MPTLVALLDLHVADRRSRRKAFSQRSSYGDLADYSQETIELEVGEIKEITFDRCIFLHIQGKVNLQVVDSNNSISNFAEVEGVFSLPVAGKVIVSVDPTSTISLPRKLSLLRA